MSHFSIVFKREHKERITVVNMFLQNEPERVDKSFVVTNPINNGEWASGESMCGQPPRCFDAGKVYVTRNYRQKDHSKHNTVYEVEEVIPAVKCRKGYYHKRYKEYKRIA
jgi:hypothetical protein